MGHRGHPLFAWCYAWLGPRQDARGTGERRRRLLEHASGRVLEFGAGTGLNLRHYPPAVTEVLACEPDPYMVRRLREVAGAAPVPVRLARAAAEALPVRDGSVDTVVASLVLCSVDDPGSALGEARRALRAGGSLLFFEHVRATDARFARRQDRIEGPWGWFSAGCHPNRDTLATIGAEGFRIEELERWDERGGGPARPHVLGRATRP